MREQADRLQVPMLMLKASKDNVVRTEEHVKLCVLGAQGRAPWPY
jgi:alpha-beta hydrolase superfamily lysophospholipase